MIAPAIFFDVYSAQNARSILTELGINAEQAVVHRVKDRATSEYKDFSYYFMCNGRNVATYTVMMHSMVTNPGVDGLGREYNWPTPYVSNDMHLITHLVSFKDGRSIDPESDTSA